MSDSESIAALQETTDQLIEQNKKLKKVVEEILKEVKDIRTIVGQIPR